MTTAVLSQDGQLTLPQEIRKRLGVNQGDRIELRVENDGSVRLRPAGRSVRDLAGFLRRPGQEAVTQEEMDEALLAGPCEAHAIASGATTLSI